MCYSMHCLLWYLVMHCLPCTFMPITVMLCTSCYAAPYHALHCTALYGTTLYCTVLTYGYSNALKSLYSTIYVLSCV